MYKVDAWGVGMCILEIFDHQYGLLKQYGKSTIIQYLESIILKLKQKFKSPDDDDTSDYSKICILLDITQGLLIEDPSTRYDLFDAVKVLIDNQMYENTSAWGEKIALLHNKFTSKDV